MNTKRFVAALVAGVALLAPACATTRAYPDHPRYERYSPYDEGFRMGRRDGEWAGYRDVGKPVRHDFWRDGHYRQGSEGYRPEYGARASYIEGYRAGYERGYRDRRASENERRH